VEETRNDGRSDKPDVYGPSVSVGSGEIRRAKIVRAAMRYCRGTDDRADNTEFCASFKQCDFAEANVNIRRF
jgi:hypothetical protein